MASIRAVIVDPDVEKRLTIQDVDPPSPLSSQAIIQVKALSLNLGEVRFSMNAEAGWRPGWDLAGVVEQAAADGSGPPERARVVGFVPSGAWAEQVAVPTHSLAVLPDNVSFAQASTLPVAGLTALYSLERNGALLGQSVLITGASGGVGHLGCTLARHMGARVVASVRRPERAQHARDAGAHEVVVGEDISDAAKFGPYHMIVESVGSETLTKSLGMLGPDGMCVTCGVSAGADVTFNARDFFRIGGAKLYGFILFHEVRAYPASEGLARLAQLISHDILKPQIEVEESWENIADVAQRFFNREIAGKAVLLL